MIQALIFDCDGTLTDSMRAHYLGWQHALAAQGMALTDHEFFRHSGTPSRILIPRLASIAGLEIDYPRALEDKETHFLQSINELKPINSVVQIARKNRGTLPMAVASGGTRRLVELQLQQIQIIDWFDTIVASEDT
ncbi:MAG: HAD family phosphatase [Pirellulaceae bacterium]|nr:HAD family phosphatase [Pirellulaceae bacterium]